MSLDHLQAFFSEGNKESIQEHRKEVKEAHKPILTASIERERQSRERYHEVGENIKKSEQLRTEILKGVKENRSIDDLLLISLECIYQMTGDKVFYNQSINKLKGRLK